MKKSILALFFALCLAFVVFGCGNVKTQKAYTFSVETGDKIRVELDTTDGYDITSDLPFEISLDDSTLSQGIFITAEQFEAYASAVDADDNAKVIETGTKDSNQYIFWSYNDSEYDFTILIEDSNTGILLGNDVSEKSARECFERLTINLDKK